MIRESVAGKRYSKGDIAKIKKAIKGYVKEGLSSNEIFERMKGEFVQVDGSPITLAWVAFRRKQFAGKRRSKTVKEKKPAKMVVGQATEGFSVSDILASNLPDSKKLKMIKILVE